MKLIQPSSNSQLIIQLEHWYSLIRKQHVKEAEKYYNTINSSFAKTVPSINTLYLLFHYRYLILLEDYENDLELNISEFDGDPKLNYYYHFFKFIHRTNTGDYQQAQHFLNNAEELLKCTNDECEIAEFNYRVSLYYYYLADPIASIYHANLCINYFSKQTDYSTKLAACENTLGMAYITLEKWELAEKYLHSSLKTFKQLNEGQLALKVQYNLGLLYSERNQPESAIQYFLQSIEHDKDYKTLFLLAREYYKTQNISHALNYLNIGKQYTNEEYKYHYDILIALIENRPIDELEIIIVTANKYFEEQQMWKEIKTYSTELAICYLKEKNHSKSNEFFYKSYLVNKL
ncbi:tetratricopeptide repeat protein [Bacillus mycoides]|uniref:tetratricopeptide repeat protein n=1 Tax=Bacillus mycoides TaxID=1405 RepID=UPI001C01F7D1|nr:tetratricopeptide repeat protein [Bacillus mycoides]QWI47472.1 tetratricopeptide repeat protein [Bacillus mycoides]